MKVSPLSFSQERLWILDQLGVGSGPYTVVAAVRLTGDLDVAGLERALREVVARHEVLRARFELRADGPAMVIEDDTDFKLRIDADIDAELRRPFVLREGGLFRALLKRGPKQSTCSC